MAYRIPNKNPLDLNQRKGIGIALPFDENAVFLSSTNWVNQLKYNLINFILTSPGERVYWPSFGSSLKGYIFTNMSGQSFQGVNEFNNNFSQMGLQDLEKLIIREVNNWFGEAINVQNFTITPNYDDNSISATMFFNTPYGATDVINFDL
jgi:hypothetical protein